ncbi:MAG TPA: hypothetical protein VLY23_12480 [Candidatus Acidoferrum sp.]|nr:hypothetical protein [Candidatus Acidoferrum sp.]
MAEEQDPNHKLPPEQEKALDYALEQMERIKREVQSVGGDEQDWSWLDFGKDYVPHDYQFDSPDFFDFLKKRKYATYHDAQMDGYVPRTKDFFLLTGHFVQRMGVLKANQEMIARLKRGKTNEGAPLAMKDSRSGYKPVGLRDFKVVRPDRLAKLRADGSLQRCLDAGTIFEAQSGAYVELIEVYAHPDIAAHLKKAIADTYSTIMAEWKRDARKPSAVRRALNFLSSKGGRGRAPMTE